MALTDYERRQAAASLELNGHNLHRTAKEFGYPLADLGSEFGMRPDPLVKAATPEEVAEARFPQWLVSVTKAGSPWPVEHADVIEEARRSHDSGVADMCTGRQGDHLYLYLIPRKVPDAARELYFSAEVLS